VLISIINAVNKFSSQKEGAQKALRIIGFLLVTTAVSAVIAIFFTRIFGLSASNLIDYKSAESKAPDVAATLLNLIPSNVFAALSSNSVLPVVLFAALAGFVTLALKKERPEIAERVNGSLEFAQSFVLKAAHIIINFTPYGILAIITVRAASGSGAFIIQLGAIIAVCFAALAAVFILHLIIAALTGTSPAAYLKAGAPALFFAFSSRSSAATVPLTIEAQKKLGVGDANANLAAAFGTCIGQNGCAGVYPPMLAILVGLVQGWDVWSLGFLLPLVAYVVIASIGTAGVGGGATNVSLLVLSLLGLPVELVAILISVDFIIDMGRTLVNVSDSILAGLVAERRESKK
jgi:L-cystine uptake protein TcyP (sodium:dicarboxylate symporter family)